MLNSIYTFSFIIAFIYLYITVSVFKNKISPYFMMLFSCIMIANFGYMQMSDAETAKMALFANQTTYLGSTFSSVFLFFCLADLCKEKLSHKLKTFLIIYSSLIFFLSSSVGVWTELGLPELYYKSYTLVEKYGIHFLRKEYGPLHVLYPVLMAICLGGGVFVIIKSFFRNRNVSYKNSILLMAMMTMTIIAYATEKLSGLEVPLIPIAYGLGQTVVFILLTRISMYDVGAIFSGLVYDSSIGGIICVDKKGNFLGADEDAYRWFPETKVLSIDMHIPSENSDLFDIIWKWILDETENDSVMLKRDGRYFKLEHSLKIENKFQKIHVIYIRDETDQMTYNQRLEEEVANKTKKLRKIQNDIIIGMASTVEGRDSNTGGHIQRTSDVVNIFVQHLQEQKIYPELEKEFWHNIIKAAPLHDFGKTGVPDAILNKPGKFTDEEYEAMKTHAAKGAEILERILMNSDDLAFKKVAVNVAHFHHEKWDGRGYPENLSGKTIPFESRVMALADVFDALVSKRVYKDRFSYDKAFGIIKESSGTHFDPELTEEFLKCRTKLEALYNNYSN